MTVCESLAIRLANMLKKTGQTSMKACSIIRLSDETLCQLYFVECQAHVTLEDYLELSSALPFRKNELRSFHEAREAAGATGLCRATEVNRSLLGIVDYSERSAYFCSTKHAADDRKVQENILEEEYAKLEALAVCPCENIGMLVASWSGSSNSAELRSGTSERNSSSTNVLAGGFVCKFHVNQIKQLMDRIAGGDYSHPLIMTPIRLTAAQKTDKLEATVAILRNLKDDEFIGQSALYGKLGRQDAAGCRPSAGQRQPTAPAAPHQQTQGQVADRQPCQPACHLVVVGLRGLGRQAGVCQRCPPLPLPAHLHIDFQPEIPEPQQTVLCRSSTRKMQRQPSRQGS